MTQVKTGGQSKPVWRIKRLLLNAFLLLLVYIFLFPFLFMLSSSLKAEADMFRFPIRWIPDVFHWENYSKAWVMGTFDIYYLNSIKISVIVTAGQLLTSILAGYAFAKIRFRGRDKLFLAYLGTMMVPFQVTMIPQFIMFKYMGITNSHLALILPGIFTAFGTFMMRQFFMGIPDELVEAAKIDGAGELRTLVRIIMPLSLPAVGSLGIFTFKWSWNDYMAPLIYLSDKSLKTIPIGLAQFKSEYITMYTLIMAAAIISLVPIMILYLLAQNSFVEGIAITGIKG